MYRITQFSERISRLGVGDDVTGEFAPKRTQFWTLLLLGKPGSRLIVHEDVQRNGNWIESGLRE